MPPLPFNKQATTLLVLILLGIATVSMFDYCSPKSSSEDAIAKEPNKQTFLSIIERVYTITKRIVG